MEDKITELAHMGSWGNYMAKNYLAGVSYNELHIEEKDMSRLFKQAEDYEKACVDYISKDSKKIEDINEISDSEEGKLLMASIAILTTENRTDKTPSEVLEELQILKLKMYANNA